MTHLRKSGSIAARLTRMNLLVSGMALLLAALAFFSYDIFSFRQNLISNLSAEAQIVGDNSVAALSFNDQESAGATLESLARSPDIQSAVLITPDGQVFASYTAPGKAEAEPRPLAKGNVDYAWAEGTEVLVAHRVVFKGQTEGTVYISARLKEIGRRARRYSVIAGTVLLFCMAAAVLISITARRYIAKPITSLANTALAVSRDRDYSVRANPGAASNEITVLVDAFNVMLGQIQERDAALNRARGELEVRVQERTSELQAANRELEAFSYTVAHDLRGPLDAVSGIVFLLTQTLRDQGDEEAREMLEQLKSSTGNMASLIDDLLNFSRASTLPLKREPVNLTPMAEEVARELKAAEPDRDVQFIIAKTPDVEADAGLMRIVLGNLLRNAWKYTSHHPKAFIKFGIRARGEKLVYFVEDDGAGFDPAMAIHLFQPFYRLHSKSQFPGTGIGLATVQRIVNRQGGRIWAEGAVEHGATFYFTV